MRSLRLDPATWDLTVDASNNIAVIEDPDALAQNAACACRLFLGELYYDTTQGVPYWSAILAHSPPLSFIKAKYIQAALTVSGVVDAQCYISSFIDRQLGGQIQVANKVGKITAATF